MAAALSNKEKTPPKNDIKFSITLSENNCKSLYVPEGFAHGYYCLEKENIIFE